MRVQWCWRCKTDVPMLDEQEFAKVASLYPHHEKRAEMLDLHEKVTGVRETNAAAIMHHRIAYYGPPCTRCGKVLRTPKASKCFECGQPARTPGGSPDEQAQTAHAPPELAGDGASPTPTFLFVVDDVFRIKGRGTVIVGRPPVERKVIRVGQVLEFRKSGRVLFRRTVRGVEVFMGPPPDVTTPVGILVSDDADSTVEAGQDVWLVPTEAVANDLHGQ